MFPNVTSLEGQGMVPHPCSSFAQLCDDNKSPFEFTRAIKAAPVTTGCCSQLKKTFINLIIEENINWGGGGGDRNSFKSTSGGSERLFYTSTAPLNPESLLPGPTDACYAVLPVSQEILIVSFLPSR